MPSTAVTHSLRLVRRRAVPPPLRPDPSQRSVIEAPFGSGPTVVLGAPGTGKTSTLIELVAHRVRTGVLDPERVLVLGATRAAASALREQITGRLQRTLVEPVARTPASYAFALLRRHAVGLEEPLPRLISGPEQDAILSELLAGHREGEGRVPLWPAAVRESLELAGFRHELRDLLMRALEHGLTSADLLALAESQDRPEWAAAAQVLEEYLEVTALAASGAYDPAALVDRAVELLDCDPDLLSAEQDRWQLVAVDDFQEASAATARLLERIRPSGTELVLFGDPDVTTQGFRGADPSLLVEAGMRFTGRDGEPARTVLLGHRWRTPPGLLEPVRAVAAGIGALGGGVHRQAPAIGGASGELLTATVHSFAQQSAWVARILREQHVLHGVPFAQQAVIVRDNATAATLRRTLSVAGVPTAAVSPELAMRDEPAVRPLLALAHSAGRGRALTGPEILELLASPLIGADPLQLRRLRRLVLAQRELLGQAQHSERLLGPALESACSQPDQDWLQLAPPGFLRLAAMLAAGRASAAAGEPASRVLWAIWQASGMATRWQQQALSGGTGGRRADRNLDAVMALFAAAERHDERFPGSTAGAFVEFIAAQQVPEDTLAPKAPESDAVVVLTPAGAIGRQWQVVVVAGVQEGVWPNLRPRGSLLGATELVDLLRRDGPVSGTVARAAARNQVLADERRLFHVAVSRTTRVLAVCAVDSDDESPSEFLQLVSGPQQPGAEAIALVPVPKARPVSFAGLIGELRSTLMSPTAGPFEREDAAFELGRLARAGVPGADPEDWYGLLPPSDEGAAFHPPGSDVMVSPSVVETVAACPLRWVLSRHGGQGLPTVKQVIGDLVHQVAQTHPEGGLAELESVRAHLFSQVEELHGWVRDREDTRSRAMVVWLAEYIRENGRELVATEEAFSVPVGEGVRLRGRVDRLERTESGDLVVVDLKTGSVAPTKAEIETHPQLGAYQMAVEVGGFRNHALHAHSGGAELVQLGNRTTRSLKRQPQPPLRNAEDPLWAAELIGEVAGAMSGAQFPARASASCSHCPVRSSCPVQPEGRHILGDGILGDGPAGDGALPGGDDGRG